jgi:hypothetical protein
MKTCWVEDQVNKDIGLLVNPCLCCDLGIDINDPSTRETKYKIRGSCC